MEIPKPEQPYPRPANAKLAPHAGRLSPEQRANMLLFFWGIPEASFAEACWVYLSRELRFSPRRRDWQGIEDLCRLAERRGKIMVFDAMADKVELEIWSSLNPPPESLAVPPWEISEKKGRGLRKWETGKPGSYPADWWGDQERFKTSELA